MPHNSKVSLGKFGAFEASEMIGKFFNVVHEIYDQGKVRLATKQSMLEDIGESFLILLRIHALN